MPKKASECSSCSVPTKENTKGGPPTSFCEKMINLRDQLRAIRVGATQPSGELKRIMSSLQEAKTELAKAKEMIPTAGPILIKISKNLNIASNRAMDLERRTIRRYRRTNREALQGIKLANQVARIRCSPDY